MRQLLGSIAAIMLVLPLSGCLASKADAEAHIKELLSQFQQLGTTLEGVKDEAGAKDALPKIKAIGAKIKDLQDNDKKVTKSSLDELMKQYQQPLHDAGLKVGMQMARLNSIPGGKDLVTEVERILKTFDKK